VSSFVLDTHAALWWSFLPDKLSRKARTNLDSADKILIPAIVFWESALLVRRRKIELPVTVGEWLSGLESSERWQVVGLEARIALAAEGLPMHDDPADRFIVATALHCGAPLVTKDRAIRSSKLVAIVW
jgi:PIN domain nuclease of toxin-antitoxin system